MAQENAPKIVLVVDDDPAVQEVIKRHLEADGYAVLGVYTADAALETAKHTKLFAALLDLGLADMDGMLLLQKIKAIKPDLPIVIVTGNHEESEGRKAFALGAWDYVTKPIDFQYLKNLLLLQSQS